MANEVKQANIWGRVGSGIGQGLAEQLPQEVDRARLSAGLKKLESNPGATQFQRLANLYTTPGMTAEMAQQLAPALNQAAVKQNRQTPREGGNQNPRISQPQGQPQPQPQQPGQPSPEAQQQNQYQYNQQANQVQPQQPDQVRNAPTSITTPEAQGAYTQPVLHGSPEQIQQRAYQLEDQYGLPPDQAYAEAKAEDATRVANAQEMQALAPREIAAEQAVKTKLDDKIQQKTHLSVGTGENGLFNVLDGEVYNRFLKKAETLKNQGRTDTQATDEISDNVKNMVKDVNTLSNNIGGRPFFGKSSAQLTQDIKNLKKSFEKEGELEYFKDLQMNHLDIGDHEASANTWPLTKNLEKAVINTSVNDSPKEIAARLYKNITPNDSIYTIGNMLSKLGIDDAAVVKELKDLSINKIYNPDPRQNRELTEYHANEFTLGDTLWSAFKEYHPVVALGRYIVGAEKAKVPAAEKIKRQFGKR